VLHFCCTLSWNVFHCLSRFVTTTVTRCDSPSPRAKSQTRPFCWIQQIAEVVISYTKLWTGELFTLYSVGHSTHSEATRHTSLNEFKIEKISQIFAVRKPLCGVSRRCTSMCMNWLSFRKGQMQRKAHLSSLLFGAKSKAARPVTESAHCRYHEV
jgi:hypothetical protein